MLLTWSFLSVCSGWTNMHGLEYMALNKESCIDSRWSSVFFTFIDQGNHNCACYDSSSLLFAYLRVSQCSSSHFRLNYQQSPRTAQLCTQAIRKRSVNSWLIRVQHPHGCRQSQYRRYKASHHKPCLLCCKVCVLVGAQHSQYVVIFVDRLIEILPLLLVPPIAVRISELTLFSGRIDVATILAKFVSKSGVE